MKAIIFRHAATSSLGSLTGALERACVEYSYIDTYHENSFDPDSVDTEVLIVLGGAMSVYQTEEYPHLKKEISVIEKRLEKDLPVLGICLGAQLIAKALGSRIYAGEYGKERGWFPVDITEAGQKTAIRHLGKDHTSMMHWHGDTFDLPEGATLLASNEAYENQAFQWGNNIMALQFHAEVTHDMMERWLLINTEDIADGTLDAQKIRNGMEDHGTILGNQVELFVLEWLEHIKCGQQEG